MKMALEHLLNCHLGTLNCPSPPVWTEPKGFTEQQELLSVGLCRERRCEVGCTGMGMARGNLALGLTRI